MMRNTVVMKIVALVVSGVMLASCGSMTNASKGYVAGTVGGAVLGAGIGALIGGDYGVDIGADLGSAVGGVTGTAIGLDQDVKELEARARALEKPQVAAQKTEKPKAEELPTFYDKKSGLVYTRVSGDDTILFGSRSSELTGEAIKEILMIASYLQDVPFEHIMIYGSTDDTESRDYSYELSRARAEAVAEYFVGIGFTEELISIEGLGDDVPLADNSTLGGRARNRCVEVYIVNEK